MISPEIFVDNWLTIAIVIIVAYQAYGYIYYKIEERRLGAKPFAKDDTDWFFGIPLFFESFRKQNDGTIIDFTAERYKSLGRDTISFRLLGKSLIGTRDPENIKAMLATQFDDFCLGKRHQQFAPLLGEGIFTLDGEGWKHSRAMLRPQFARDQVGHVMALEPHVQLLVKQIKRFHGKEFDIQELFFRFTVDSATEFLFGESVSSLQDSKITLREKMEDVVNFDGKKEFAGAFNDTQITLSLRSLAQQFYFLFDGNDFRSNISKVHRFGDYYVKRALDATPEELEEKSKGGYIFLYELVKETRNPKILRDQLLNILIAGRDTTAGLLSFTFFELARRPDVWNKLKEEIHSRFGSGANSRIEDISFESLKKCSYLKAILNEVLRMYPSVPKNIRYAQKNTTLPRGGGIDGKSPVLIPKGKSVIYSVSSMHKDEKYYGEDANVFRPERWLTGETKKLGWAYLPFNGGPRICLGQQFALTEASFVITRLVQIFPNIESFDDEYPPRKASHLTMCHKGGVLIGLS